MLIQVAYETDHISLLHNSTMSNALNFWFFYVFYCNLKEKYHIKIIINIIKKKYLYMKSVLLLFWFTKN